MRYPRALSRNYVYHIMVRGNGKKDIFLDINDRQKMIELFSEKRKQSKFIIYGYCLMQNHCHILIKTDKEDISTVMKRLNTSYALYFNKKYNKVGHLFQDRFKSEPIDTERYLLAALRYIHNNPVKANLVTSPEKYIWSSYRAYISDEHKYDFLDTGFILSHFAEDSSKSIEIFKNFSFAENQDQFIDIDDEQEKDLFTIDSIRKFTIDFLNTNNIDYKSLINEKINVRLRNEFIIQLKNRSTFSNRELSEILKVDRNKIQRAR